ncbi:MAG: transposase [Syntrophaceae bacterium]|nr:transposase [Syntrophaceae bacterium]
MIDVFQLIQDGKIRRYFRSRKKLIHAGLISHVTQRAAGKDLLFVDKHDYLAMLGFMKELSADYETSIYAFCLMPNHIHILLRPGQENLHLFFRDLFGRHSRRFNRRYERKGHLFGGPFRQSVILDEGYLLAASLYIHLNPVRAGLVSDPCEYRFSSCRLYARKEAPESFVDSQLVLSLLSEREGEQVARYNELLDRGRELDSGNVLEDERAIERFRSLLKNAFPPFLFKFRKKRSEPAGVFSSDFSADELDDFENLRGLRKPESMAAKKYLVEQLLARGYTRTQIADNLGISRKTVYNLLAYGEN